MEGFEVRISIKFLNDLKIKAEGLQQLNNWDDAKHLPSSAIKLSLNIIGNLLATIWTEILKIRFPKIDALP